MSELEELEDVEIPDWVPPVRMVCKHYEQANGKDICRVGGDRRIINDEWCIGCKKYEPGTIEAPPQERKETMMKTEQRRVRFDWDQPALNIFAEAGGETLREYLKQKVADNPGCAAALAMNLGVTPSALTQAISRELRPRTVIRTPLGINWEAPAVDGVGNKHPVNPCRVSLINWCSDCLDEECYTREELAKLIGCKPEDLQAALNKYLGDTGDELDEEEPETECVNQQNNIPEDATPEPEPVISEFNPHGVKICKAPVDVDGEILWQGPAVDTFPEVEDHNGDTLIQYLVRLCRRSDFNDLASMAEALGCSEIELFSELELRSAREQQKVKALQQTAADRNSEFDKSNSACFCGDACATRDTAEPAEPCEQQAGSDPTGNYTGIELAVSGDAALAYLEMIGVPIRDFQLFCSGWNMRITGDPAKSE